MQQTLSVARNELIEREAQFLRRPVSVARLRTEPGMILIDDEPLRISDEGLSRLCRQIGAPVNYVPTVSPALQAQILQYHIDQRDLKHDVVELVTRNDELVAIDYDSLHRLTSVNVVDAVVDGIGSSEIKVQSLRVQHEWLELNLLSDLADTEVSPGDVVQGGLQISHSFVGDGATSVQAFVYRLICKNGMTHRECVSKKSSRTRRLPANRPDAHALQMDQVRRLTAETMQSLNLKLAALTALQQERIEVEHLMQRWIERGRLSTRDLMPRLRAAWLEEGGRPTAYDAMNALTRVATHGENLDWRVRRTLASLAGILAFRQIHFCPRCFSLLSSSSNSVQAS